MAQTKPKLTSSSTALAPVISSLIPSEICGVYAQPFRYQQLIQSIHVLHNELLLFTALSGFDVPLDTSLAVYGIQHVLR